jgi:hypothetical protein
VRRELLLTAAPGRRARLLTVASFTVPEAARALGKTTARLRRWIADGIVPPPILRAGRGHLCYEAGELAALAAQLAAHERDYAYLCAKHQPTIAALRQALATYRERAFGATPTTGRAGPE